MFSTFEHVVRLGRVEIRVEVHFKISVELVGSKFGQTQRKFDTTDFI